MTGHGGSLNNVSDQCGVMPHLQSGADWDGRAFGATGL